MGKVTRLDRHRRAASKAITKPLAKKMGLPPPRLTFAMPDDVIGVEIRIPPTTLRERLDQACVAHATKSADGGPSIRNFWRELVERIEALEKKSRPAGANLVGGEEFEALKRRVAELERMVSDGK